MRAGRFGAGAAAAASASRRLLRASMTLIFKIVASGEWLAANRPALSPAPLSTGLTAISIFRPPRRRRETAAKWFAGRDDLTLVAVDAEALGEPISSGSRRAAARFFRISMRRSPMRRRHVVAPAAARSGRSPRLRELA